MPAGGITRWGVKMTIWLYRDEAEALRRSACKERRSEATIIRELSRS